MKLLYNLKQVLLLICIPLVCVGCGVRVKKPPGLLAIAPITAGCHILTGEYLTAGYEFVDWGDRENRFCDLKGQEILLEKTPEFDTFRCRCISQLVQEGCSKLMVISKTASGREISRITREIDVSSDGGINLRTQSNNAHSDGFSLGRVTHSSTAYSSKEGWIILKAKKLEKGVVLIPPSPYWSGDESWSQIPTVKDVQNVKFYCRNK